MKNDLKKNDHLEDVVTCQQAPEPVGGRRMVSCCVLLWVEDLEPQNKSYVTTPLSKAVLLFLGLSS